MTDTHMKKDDKGVAGVNPVIAGIAGVVAGGMAVAAAVAISNKDNQKKVADAVNDAKDKVVGYVDEMTSKPALDKAARAVTDKVTEVKKKIEAKI